MLEQSPDPTTMRANEENIIHMSLIVLIFIEYKCFLQLLEGKFTEIASCHRSLADTLFLDVFSTIEMELEKKNRVY
jgi:hypothetical protein